MKTGQRFPTLNDFKYYLEEFKDLKWSSSHKSIFLFVETYFKSHPFTVEETIKLLYTLRTTTELKKQKLKTGVVNDYLYYIQVIGEMMDMNEFKALKPKKVNPDDVERRGDFISHKDARRVIACDLERKFAHKDGETREAINLKWRAVFTLLHYAAPSTCDVCDMQWRHDKGTYFVFRRNKTGIKVHFPILPELRNLLDALPRYPHEYIFASPRGRMKEQTIRIELKKRTQMLNIKGHITPGSFRSSAETWCWENANDNMIAALADIFGHTVEIARKHYVDSEQRIQYLTDVLCATHPSLIDYSSIDTVKRLALKMLTPLVDRAPYQIELIIKPKATNLRLLHLS